MMLVDSSTWVDFFRGADTPQVALLDASLGRRPIAVLDLIATEVLQGVRDDQQFEWVRQAFDRFHHIDLCGYALAVKAAGNHRKLRSLGLSVRKTINTLIATRCIEDGLELLHTDSDFKPFAMHLGLIEAYAEA